MVRDLTAFALAASARRPLTGLVLALAFLAAAPAHANRGTARVTLRHAPNGKDTILIDDPDGIDTVFVEHIGPPRQYAWFRQTNWPTHVEICFPTLDDWETSSHRITIWDCMSFLGMADSVWHIGAGREPFRLPCLFGNVNAGAGAIEDVLFVNQNPGGPILPLNSLIEVELRAASRGPAAAQYVLFVWAGTASNPTDVPVNGMSIGCAANPTPLQPGQAPQPIRCLRGGLGPEFCNGVQTLPSPARAPWILRRPQGFSRPIVLTLQAVIEDATAGHSGGLSVSNAVTMAVR